MKTLIVEDDAGTRALVKRIVSQSSAGVLEATNGLDALSIVEREDPDLVITDLRMPLLDGFELIAALRGSAAHANIPIICLTSVGQREEIARLLESGITDYVLKPVKPTELTDRVRRAFAANANWRDERNQRLNRDNGASTMLVMDPDATFRALVKAQLEGDYEVILGADAAEGLRLFHERKVKPQSVFIAEHLPSLNEERTADLLKQIAIAAGAAAPQVFAIVDDDEDRAPATGSAISGTIRRTLVPAHLSSAFRAVLPAGRSPADRLREVLLSNSNARLMSVARHAFGVVTGLEIVATPGAHRDAEETISVVRLPLSDSSIAVVVSLRASADAAAALATESAASSPDCDGPELLGKLVAMIGCDLGGLLKSRGFVTLNPTSEVLAEDEPDADVLVGLKAPGGQTLTLTATVIEPGAPVE